MKVRSNGRGEPHDQGGPRGEPHDQGGPGGEPHDQGGPRPSHRGGVDWAVVGIVGGGALVAAAVFVCACRRWRSRWAVSPEERRLLTVKVQSAVQELAVTRPHGDTFPVKDTGKFSPLVFGNFDEATTALEDFLCVDHRKHHLRMARQAPLSLHPSTLTCTPQPSPAPLNPHLHPSTLIPQARGLDRGGDRENGGAR